MSSRLRLAAAVLGVLSVCLVLVLLHQGAGGGRAAPPPPTGEGPAVLPLQDPAPDPPAEPAPGEIPAEPPVVLQVLPPPVRVEVTVRDLLTAMPVANSTIRFGDADLVTDAGGRIAVLVEEVETIALPEGSEWRRAGFAAGDARALVRTLWVYRTMRIEGRVVAHSGLIELEPGSVNVVAVHEQAGTGAHGEELGQAFIRQIGLEQIRHRGPIGQTGEFSFQLPRLPGYVLCALAPGWQPARAQLTTEEHQLVDLGLEKESLSIRGVLRNPEGRPIAGAVVRGYVTVLMSADEFDEERIRAVGHAWTANVSRTKNTARVTYQIGTTTGPDGSFELHANARGRLDLQLVSAHQVKPRYERVGDLEADVSGLTYTLDRLSGNTIKITLGGTGLTGKRLTVCNLDRDFQPTLGFRLDEKSEIPVEALERGREYAFTIREMPLRPWFLTWDGRRSIELNDLKTRRY